MDITEAKLLKQIFDLLDERDYVGAKNQLDKLVEHTKPIE